MAKSKYSFVDVTQPQEGKEVFLNRWWVCQNGNPTEAVYYLGKFPQCSIYKEVVQNMNSYKTVENPSLVFLAVSYGLNTQI